MDFNLVKTIIFFTAAFFEIVLVLIFWFRSKSKEGALMGWIALFSALYCLSYGATYFFEQGSLFWSRSRWIGIFIVPSAYAFSYYFSGRKKYFRLKVASFYLSAAIIFFLALLTPYFIKSFDFATIKTTLGPLDSLGRLYIVVGGGISIYHLLREYLKSSGERRDKMKFFLLGVAINFFGSFITGGLIPLLIPGIGHIFITPMLTLPGIIIITYVIFKEKLFQVRLFLTEVLVGIIGAIMLTQAILAENILRQALGFFILVIFLIMGYILIVVTDKEMKKTEEAEELTKRLKKLNETLEQKVGKRTKELKESYYELKEKNKELEKFYSLVVGRELEMIEMKKELKEVKKRFTLKSKGVK